MIKFLKKLKNFYICKRKEENEVKKPIHLAAPHEE